MLEKVQWPPNNSPNLNGMEISCHARSYFETFIQSSKQFLNQKSQIWDHFPQVKLIKLSRPEFYIVWYVNGDGRHFKHLSHWKKVFACTVWKRLYISSECLHHLVWPSFYLSQPKCRYVLRMLPSTEALNTGWYKQICVSRPLSPFVSETVGNMHGDQIRHLNPCWDGRVSSVSK